MRVEAGTGAVRVRGRRRSRSRALLVQRLGVLAIVAVVCGVVLGLVFAGSPGRIAAGVRIDADAPEATARTGTVTVAGHTVTVHQDAAGLSGEWRGTITGVLHAGCNSNCSDNRTSNFDMHIATNGTTISGPATWDGLPCWDCNSCALLELDNSSGSITGTVGTSTAQFSYSGTYSGSACNGNGIDFTVTAVITNGTTMTGTTSFGQQMILNKVQ